MEKMLKGLIFNFYFFSNNPTHWINIKPLISLFFYLVVGTRHMTSLQESLDRLSILVRILLECGHMVGVPDPPGLRPPPLHVLAHHSVQPPGGDQLVGLGVDEEHGPGAGVLVLQPVTTPGHAGVPGQPPRLPGHQLEVLPQTHTIGAVDAEVCQCQEQSSRSLSLCPRLVRELSGAWPGVKHWPSDPEVTRLVSQLGHKVLVHSGAVIAEGHSDHTPDPLLGDFIQNRSRERGHAPGVIVENVLFWQNAGNGFVTQAVVEHRVFVQLFEAAASKAKEKNCKIIRNCFRLLWRCCIGHFECDRTGAHSGCWQTLDMESVGKMSAL